MKSTISSKPLASMGPPNHRGFIRGRDGPPRHCCNLELNDDREDARKVWGFEQMRTEIPLTRGFR